MLNFIWCAIMLVSIVCSFLCGTVSETATAIMDGAKNAVEFIIKVGSVMALWSGVMAVCEKSGMSKIFAKLLSPLIKVLFTTRNKKTQNAISLNMTANILGLSNAATSLGIEAMKDLHAENGQKNTASHDMCMLAVINSASIQLIPSTLIAIRSQFGAKNPSEIIVPIWITSLIVFIFGVLCVLLCRKGVDIN